MYQPNTNYRQTGQNIYGNQLNRNQNNSNNIYGRNNQTNLNKNNNAPNNKNTKNQKYGDLQIEAIFGDGRAQNISPQDYELKKKLDNITNQYTAIFDNINNLANKFSGGNQDAYKFNSIKKEFEEIDDYCGTEHGKFISELYDISKDNKVLNYDYKKYKQNSRDCDENLKKIIAANQYDVLLSVNSNNSTDNKNRLRKYINNKKNKNKKNDNDNYSNKNKYDNPNSYESESKNNNYNFGNSIYGDNNNQQNFNFGNDIYSNSNKKYENPNEVGNDDYYNNRNMGKISVKFIYRNSEKKMEYNSYESAEYLYYTALELKDDPRIYDKNGAVLTYDYLKDKKIYQIFANSEPILDVY
jgi:hypothetical protein